MRIDAMTVPDRYSDLLVGNVPLVVVAATLVLAVLLASMRLLRLHRGKASASTGRWPTWRLLAVLLLQPLAAASLWLTLFPPDRDAAPAGTLTVLTGGWREAANMPTEWDPSTTFALPEAGDVASISALPDLATALRLRGEQAMLRVVGSGLPLRDLDAAAGRVERFERAPLPAGLVELQAPTEIVAGQPIAIRGRVHGPVRDVVLLDPGGDPLARTAPDAEGRIALAAEARGSGPQTLVLQLLDPADIEIERVAVAFAVQPAAQPRVLLLAAAPGPELKFLRRWATDAAVELHSRITLTERVLQRGGEPVLDRAALDRFDLVIVDDRSWLSLDGGQRDDLLQAVEAGLGLLLRLTATPSPEVLAALDRFGFEAGPADPAAASEVTLDAASAATGGDSAAADPSAAPTTERVAASPDAHAAPAAPPVLHRHPLSIGADDAIALLRPGPDLLASWRPLGRGRIGVWTLGDSYRLVLGGHARRHAALWADAVGTLARADGRAPPQWNPSLARSGQRLVLCGLAGEARVIAPDGAGTPLHVEDDASRCAGYWPREPGFHRLEPGPHWLYVRAADEAPALAAATLARQTERLAEQALTTADASATHGRVPASPWPLFAAWLLLMSALALLGRRRMDG